MKNNALSVANYFISLAERDNKSLQPLKLIKLVYIAYGFGLATLGRSIIDYRFDKVEAWRFGPVIPSVYHSFKMFGKGDVRNHKTGMWIDDYGDVQEAELKDDFVKALCDMVWELYGSMTGYDLVELLHSPGTPWASVYVEGRNVPIPEETTKRYYSYLVKIKMERAKADGELS